MSCDVSPVAMFYIENLLIIPWSQTVWGVAVDDWEEDGVEEKDVGGHHKAELLACFSALLSPKRNGGEFSKHSKDDMARSQVLQNLPAGDLQHQEDNDRKPKGKAQVEVEQVSVRYQSQGDDPEESGQGVDRSKPNEQDELLLEGNLVEVNLFAKGERAFGPGLAYQQQWGEGGA